ncbi:unnamed protein product, partial [Closterium sp. Naga37s-1]
ESDLSDLAAEHSLCASREKGGMVGWISKGSTEPEFEEAAFKARPGDVVRCKTKHGWHLLQVLGDRHAAVLDQVTVEEFARRLSEEYVMPLPQGGAAGRGAGDSEGRSLEAELAEAQAESEGRRAVQLVDVREAREVEMAAIPGFTVLPLSQFGQWGPSIADTLDPHTDTYLLVSHTTTQDRRPATHPRSLPPSLPSTLAPFHPCSILCSSLLSLPSSYPFLRSTSPVIRPSPSLTTTPSPFPLSSCSVPPVSSSPPRVDPLIPSLHLVHIPQHRHSWSFAACSSTHNNATYYSATSSPTPPMCSLLPCLQGFTRLFNIAGGIDAYSLRVDPSIPRY